MKKLFLVLGFLSLKTCLFSQLNTDSLHSLIKSGDSYSIKIKAALAILTNYETKNFDSTIYYGSQALSLARENGDSTAVANIKRHIGLAHYFKGDYHIAAKYFFESIDILERNNDKKNLAPTYNELAKLYRRIKELDKAIDIYNKASVIYKSLKDTAGLAMILNESGVAYEYQENYQEALSRYKSSLMLAQSIGDSLSVSYSLSNIAGIDIIRQQYSRAEENLLRALKIRQILKDSFSIAITYSDLGSTMSKKGDYEKSITYFLESNRLAEKIKYLELQSNNYNELSIVAQKQGDFQKALNFFSKSTALHDTIYNIEKNKQIEMLNSLYENSKKEHQISEQNSRIKLHNYLFLGIGLLILLAAVLIYLLYKKYTLKKENQVQSILMHQQESAAVSIMEAEENERKRIATDLHDGIGQMMSAAKLNLSALEDQLVFSGIEQKNHYENIISMVDDSCKEIRSISHSMMPIALIKSGLAQAVKQFLNNLNGLPIKINFYTEGLTERVDSKIEIILFRIIQEIVNNTIKHAEASRLDISLTKEIHSINLIIEDNGKGFDITLAKNKEGIGLKNIESRVNFLKGTIEWDSKIGEGTVTAIYIPL
ncbi:MAG: sensor histidine kinase [Chitinophagaceae bacterium]|nr:sensor histidine kinase [Chitinophagaceae bacterium]